MWYSGNKDWSGEAVFITGGENIQYSGEKQIGLDTQLTGTLDPDLSLPRFKWQMRVIIFSYYNVCECKYKCIAGTVPEKKSSEAM